MRRLPARVARQVTVHATLMSVLDVRIGSVTDVTPEHGQQGSGADPAGLPTKRAALGGDSVVDDAVTGLDESGTDQHSVDEVRVAEVSVDVVQVPTDDGGVLEELDPAALRRWAFRARAALARHRGGIDALNVFPVPDGDTGTNMLATLTGALRTVRDQRGLSGATGVSGVATPAAAGAPGAAAESDEAGTPVDLHPAGHSGSSSGAVDHPEPAASEMRVEALARKTLLSARGNSGVILSELLRGLSQGLSQVVGAGRARIDGPALAAALRSASERAWHAVGRPVDGTMLSVARDAAAAADQAARRGGRLVDVTDAAVDGARQALAATPDQLPTLKRAGVVDAGGAGLLVVLNALHEVVSGDRTKPDLPESSGELPAELALLAGATQSPGSLDGTPAGGERGCGVHVGTVMADGPEFEVMYVVTAPAGASGVDEIARTQLVGELDALGDCVVVAGDRQALRVHVHTDDAQAAVTCGQAVGDVHDTRIERLVPSSRQSGLSSSGSGLRLFTRLSAPVGDDVPGRHLRTTEEVAAEVSAVLDAAVALDGPPALGGDPEVSQTHVILVTDLGSADLAGSLLRHPRLHVISCDHLPAAFAALSVYDGGAHTGVARDLEDRVELDVAVMSRAASGVRAVEVRCADDAARVDELLADGGELVTIVVAASGGDRGAAEADALKKHLQGGAVDVTRLDVPELRPGVLLIVGVE